MSRGNRVVIGMDPHKRSATIEAMAEDETVLGKGRYGTDPAGFDGVDGRGREVAAAGVGGGGLRRHRQACTRWTGTTVRANVARWAAEAIDPAAYVIDDSGFPKDGTASPCVARQYSGTLGKTGNCQIGVSVQMATDTASVAADWRLFCPASWDDTTISDPAKAARSVKNGTGPASATTCGTGRSGAWPWTCSTR